MNRLAPRLTYANVVATLALFLALGGGAYAAIHLPKNSVGTRQLKKKSVTTAKIRNGAVTGVKIKLSSLGTVPSAARASTAGDAQTLSGKSAEQLTGESKLTCPAETAMVANLCVEEAERSAATWVVATKICAKASRRLPSPGELTGYTYAKNPGTVDWTDSLFYSGSSYYAVSVSVTELSTVFGSYPVSGTEPQALPYRCVVPPGN